MISFCMPGNIRHFDILKYYIENEVDCFVHTSESEGGPAVIMEAESAGIPIVATDVGVTSEAICENGVLLPVDCTSQMVADALLGVLTSASETKKSMRDASRKIWEQKFDAHKNAVVFADYVQRIADERKSLYFLTEGFPYKSGEETFFRNELKELAVRFDVTIVPRIYGDITNDMEQFAEQMLEECLGDDVECDNVRVLPYTEKWSLAESVISTIKYFVDKKTVLERKTIRNGKTRCRIRTWESIKFYGKSMKFFRWFSRSIDLNDLYNAMVYSYWNLEPVLGISLNRDRNINMRIITRAHGYDWQDEQWTGSFRKPFAETADLLLDSVIFDSEKGRNTYMERYGINSEDAGKHTYSYFGSVDVRSLKLETFGFDRDIDAVRKTLKVASCAALIPLKRINLLIDALGIIKSSRPDLDIEWVHFGDGPLKDDLQKHAMTVLG